jgi:hypothetical protein
MESLTELIPWGLIDKMTRIKLLSSCCVLVDLVAGLGGGEQFVVGDHDTIYISRLSLSTKWLFVHSIQR